MASLSIGNLKSILFSNHVNAGLILEKAELVKKVHDLVEDERRERERMERQHQLEEEEERERIRLQREEAEQEERRRRERAAQEAEAASNTNQDQPPASTSPPSVSSDINMERETSNPSPPPKSEPIAAPTFPKSNISAFERNGLCVICQDEEANIAIVDCGCVSRYPLPLRFIMTCVQMLAISLCAGAVQTLSWPVRANARCAVHE